MILHKFFILGLALIFLFFQTTLFGQNLALQPVAPKAGSGAVTLLVSNAVAQPFSLLEVRSLIVTLLSRVETKIVLRSDETVTAEDFSAADYLFFLGIGEWTLNPWMADLHSLKKPTFFMGTSPLRPTDREGNRTVNAPEATGRMIPAAVLMRGAAQFETSLSFLLAEPSPLPEDAEVLATVAWEGRSQLLAWRQGQLFRFLALPVEPATGFIFSDVVLDFYGVEDAGTSGVLCLIDNFYSGCDPATLRRVADLLNAENRPFALSVRLPEETLKPERAHALVAALHYAQVRGGHLLLAGIPDDPGFWDVSLDRPSGEAQILASAERWKKEFHRALGEGLFPLGVHLPDSGWSSSAALQVAKSFQLALGTPMASDATAAATFSPGTLTKKTPGLLLLPAGAWFDGVSPSPTQLAMAKNVLKLRGMIVTVSLPAWQSFALLEPALRTALDLPSPFLDLLDAPALIRTEEAVLLSREVEAVSLPFPGPIEVQAFDRRARQVSQEILEKEGGEGNYFSRTDSAAFLVLKPAVQ